VFIKTRSALFQSWHVLFTQNHTYTADEGDAFLEIQAGAGGRESGDWVEILLVMYKRWAAQKGFEVRCRGRVLIVVV